MTQKEIVTALRCHYKAIETGKCPENQCPAYKRPSRGRCPGTIARNAADLIENQQKTIEALRQANEGLRFNLSAQEGDEICRAALEAIAEEIADVEIMLRQMVILFDCAGQVEPFRRYKLERLAERIKEVKQ